ncbi:energy-coupling factor ABC transporter ATP-binding protein [Bartonella sp. HY406]|uniref:energy-coupling factor ABC transporter ATP-binding protein n=1 Tax=Bartonella sp. HY406 TaxID=2979331 RepID=UPI0021CAE2B2|nr:ABC transporter ATP-binding protein [Bartonella sp. HY406]UXN03439.1 energy-coupling factor ABC transporter ATP-binding protein [Bartonella sp. HY406]
MKIATATALASPTCDKHIQLEDVTLKLGNKTILQSINVTLQQQRIGVIGANGSGKSSFARLLNGLLLPNTGTVFIDGLDTKKDGKNIRRKVGFIFQNPDNQIIMPTIEEDIAFGLKNMKLTKAEIQRRSDDVLQLYNLDAIKTSSAHNLSGGQKQLLAICGVLVMQPEIMVFDEPTTMLDLRNKKRIAALINNLPQRVVLVSHDLELLQDFDRVIVIDEGKIAYDGSAYDAIEFYKNLMQ